MPAPKQAIHDYLATGAVAERLGVTVLHVGLLCRTGKLKAEKFGSSWLVDPASVTSYQAHIKEAYQSQGKKRPGPRGKAFLPEGRP